MAMPNDDLRQTAALEQALGDLKQKMLKYLESHPLDDAYRQFDKSELYAWVTARFDQLTDVPAQAAGAHAVAQAGKSPASQAKTGPPRYDDKAGKQLVADLGELAARLRHLAERRRSLRASLLDSHPGGWSGPERADFDRLFDGQQKALEDLAARAAAQADQVKAANTEYLRKR